MERAPRIEPDPAFRTSFEREIGGNKLKSAALATSVFFVLLALMWVISSLYGGVASGFFFTIGLFFVLLYISVSYFYGDQIVLSSVNAKPLDTGTPKGKYVDSLVEGLCIAARLPKPKIYVMESGEMNAFATGRDPEHASIAYTSAILEKLDRAEIEGVTAHELSHVANYDVRFALFVAVMVGLIAIIAGMLQRSMWYGGGRRGEDRRGGNALIVIFAFLLAIFAPIAVRLVQAAISRKREFLADASGARLTRYPEGLASALEKLARGNRGDMQVNEAVSHLFLADPLRSHLDDLFATHPPIEERIKLLRAM